MLDQFKRNSSSGSSRQVKEWVRSALQLSDEYGILVTELKCTEPGCPPIETVVAVLQPDGKQHQQKIHRASSEITESDAREIALKLQRVMAGENKDTKEEWDGHH